MYKKYSVEEKKRVVSLFFDGTPVSQLTSDTDIPRSTIYRWIRESKAEEGNSNIYSPLNYYMLEKKYKKLQSIIEILQKVSCKPTDPLSIKLPEMESLYGQYSVHTLCDALPVIEEMAHFMLSCFDTMTEDQAELIIQMVSNRDSITRRDVIELLRVSSNQAGYLLKKLVGEGKLRLIDTRKKAHYVFV